MFITVKRHQREKQELISASHRLADAILKNSSQGLFLLDAKDRILPQVSHSLALLFRRQDFTNLTFEKLLAPLVTAKTLTVVRNYISGLLSGVSAADAADAQPLKDIDVRLMNPDGSHQLAHYSFDFDLLDAAQERVWLVRVSDITMQVQNGRELDELRTEVRTQGEILRGVLKMGGARFGVFLQRTDAAMKNINNALKKPSRKEDAFRNKLEETLEEVDRIRREAAAFKLTALESAARSFEDALQDLRSRSGLSGSDFLPLAVKLDRLYGQFALVKSFTVAAKNSREPDAAGPTAGVAPKVMEELEFKAASAAHRAAPAGSLDSTLQSLTDHVAEEQSKPVVLETHGLQSVPAAYQAAVKNVAIQLIRNAVMHGIETAAIREAGGKPAHGTLRIEFRTLSDKFELLFEDDGCGLDPDQVRATAVLRGVLDGEAAARLRDREAIKLIFKSGFTTLESSPGDKAHGGGLSLVRRYIHDAGGKIALASLPGHQTRFKLTLPAAGAELASASDAQVA